MIAIRHKCFETNSSSTSSFSYDSDENIFGTITFIIKVKSDVMTDEKVEELQSYLTGWLSKRGYAKNVNLVDSKLISEEDGLFTYRMVVSGKYQMNIKVYCREFMSHRYDKEPDEYYVHDYRTQVKKNTKKLAEFFNTYIEKNSTDINFTLVDIVSENEDFDDDDLDAVLDEDPDDYYDNWDDGDDSLY